MRLLLCVSRAIAKRALPPIVDMATREPEFKQALVDGLAPYRTADGRYRLSNAYHYLIARA
jgi:hypothetical protein